VALPVLILAESRDEIVLEEMGTGVAIDVCSVIGIGYVTLQGNVLEEPVVEVRGKVVVVGRKVLDGRYNCSLVVEFKELDEDIAEDSDAGADMNINVRIGSAASTR